MANILIADDDPILVELMRSLLSAAGHKIEACGSGLEALKRLGIQPEDASAALPDLLILDLMMPKSDGYTVGTVIRNHARTRSLPILVASSLNEPSRLFTATVEVDGFLNKGSLAESLVPTVGKILQQRSSRS